MTINNVAASPRQTRLAVNSGQTVFPFAWPIYAATDLAVHRLSGGVLTRLAYGADYSVTGTNQQTGGTVVMTTAPSTSDTIIITSNQVIERTTDFQNGGDLPAQSLDDEFNRMVIDLQQLAAIGARSVRTDVTDVPIAALPLAAARANQLLVFDSQGQPSTAAIPGAGTSLTGNASLATRTATGTTQARTFAEAASDILWLQDFSGVDTTGVAASDAAVAAWFAQGKASGKEMRFPSGRIKCTSPVIWSLVGANDGGRVLGAGGHNTILDVQSVPAATQFQVRAPLGNDAFYWTFAGFRIEAGGAAGTNGIKFGEKDGSHLSLDAFNGCHFDLICASSYVGNATAVELHGIYNSEINIVAGCDSPSTGAAMLLNQVAFCRGRLSPGSAQYGVVLGLFCFANTFTACDFEVVQTPLLSIPTSNAAGNSFAGTFVWGNAAPNWDNGVSNFAILPALGGPLYITPESNIASNGGIANPTGAAISLLRLEGRNQGDWEAGGLAIYRPDNLPARLLFDTEVGEESQILHYRNQSLRWMERRDAGAESGGTSRVNSSLIFQAYDDTGANARATLTLFRDGRAQVLGAANGLLLTGAAGGSDVGLSAVGTDTNITVVLQPKGTGKLSLAGSSVVGSASGTLGFYGATGVTRAAAPTTLADVIAIIRNTGLSA